MTELFAAMLASLAMFVNVAVFHFNEGETIFIERKVWSGEECTRSIRFYGDRLPSDAVWYLNQNDRIKRVPDRLLDEGMLFESSCDMSTAKLYWIVKPGSWEENDNAESWTKIVYENTN